jgi:hypothetical protein
MSEQENRRYNFNGYTFGDNGDFNLVIETATSQFGYSTQYAIELSTVERQELITLLLTTKGKKDN